MRRPLILLVALALAACGGGNDDDSPSAAAPAATTVATAPPAATASPAATAPAATTTATASAAPTEKPAKTATPEATGTPEAGATPAPAPTVEPTPVPKEKAVLSCLKLAKLDDPARQNAGRWGATLPHSRQPVLVDGPFKTEAEVKDSMSTLEGITLVEPAGRYMVTAALTSHAGKQVKQVARCVKSRT